MITMNSRTISIVAILLSIHTTYSSHLIETCSVYSDTFMDCSNQNMTEIPSLIDLPSSIEFLNLSWNKISKISAINISEEHSKLQGISLSHNEISSFEFGSFGNLKHLQVLDLSFNKIQGSMLQDENGFEKIKVPYLEKLSFRGNPIGALKRESFTSFSYFKLKFLDLSLCSIKTIENDAIINLPRLKSLNLSHNYLQQYNPEFMEAVMELESLDLSFNRINSIHEFPLLLKKIYLQNNKISAVKDNAFASVTNLKYLNLANNNIRELSPLSVPWETAQMSLQGNPWRCDCHMRWLKLPNKEIDVQAINITMICVYPSRLRGMEMKQLSSTDLICPTSFAGPVVAVLLSTFLVLVSLVIAYALYRKRKAMPCRKSKDQSGNYVAVYTHDELDETQAKVSIDEVNLVGGKEIYA